jgi:hypothetical protein
MPAARFFAYSAPSKSPYLARATLAWDTFSRGAKSTPAELTAHTATKLVEVEMDLGVTLAIECNPPNRSVEADENSPRYAGKVKFEAGPGWQFSILEIA